MKNHKLILTGLYLLIVSAFLTLAIDQAIFLTRLYRASTAASPLTDFSSLRRPGFSLDLLILVVVAVVLFLLVRKHLRRLLPVSIAALLLFFALNLYSGRHLLPQLLIWPSPPSLAEQYTQALAAGDFDAALSLTDGSPACESVMAQVFQTHQRQRQQKLAGAESEMGFQDTAIQSIVTFYKKPVPSTVALMQPPPGQLVTAVAELENGQTMWLNLKLGYTPYWGPRYICGQEMGD